MTPFEADAQRARDDFREALASAGFNVSSSTHASGELAITGSDRPIELDITIPDDFPYRPPSVKPTYGDGGMSWHRDSDGSLCLYPPNDPGEPRWRHATDFLDKVRDWFAQDAAGWPDDTPDLDLERYWEAHLTRIVYFGDLDWNLDQTLRGAYDNDGTRALRIRPGAPNRGKKRERKIGARALDIGDIAEPVHNWTELAAQIGETEKLERLIIDHQVQVLMVRYWRGGHAGTLALWVTSTDPIEFATMIPAHNGDATIRMRAGFDATLLRSASVAVVGLGAVGSYVADGLARAGVSRLSLVDGDIMRPGNLVRHVLASPNWIGAPKATATAQHLLSMPWAPGDVTAHERHLSSIEDTVALFESHDLVIDATATGYATALILDASHALNRPALSVCVLRDGGILRVDRSPLQKGETFEPPIPTGSADTAAQREIGCGDPVSPTPPWACVRAATAAVAAATDLLAGRLQHGPSHTEILIAQPDFNQLGTVR